MNKTGTEFNFRRHCQKVFSPAYGAPTSRSKTAATSVLGEQAVLKGCNIWRGGSAQHERHEAGRRITR
jgi:hypothetical protein